MPWNLLQLKLGRKDLVKLSIFVSELDHGPYFGFPPVHKALKDVLMGSKVDSSIVAD